VNSHAARALQSSLMAFVRFAPELLPARLTSIPIVRAGTMSTGMPRTSRSPEPEDTPSQMEGENNGLRRTRCLRESSSRSADVPPQEFHPDLHQESWDVTGMARTSRSPEVEGTPCIIQGENLGFRRARCF
jgi:hypothetical protein